MVLLTVTRPSFEVRTPPGSVICTAEAPAAAAAPAAGSCRAVRRGAGSAADAACSCQCVNQPLSRSVCQWLPAACSAGETISSAGDWPRGSPPFAAGSFSGPPVVGGAVGVCPLCSGSGVGSPTVPPFSAGAAA